MPDPTRGPAKKPPNAAVAHRTDPRSPWVARRRRRTALLAGVARSTAVAVVTRPLTPGSANATAMTDVAVVAVCGSLRDTSYTRTALKYALDAADEAGASTQLLDLSEADVPMYDPDVDDQGVADALALVERADAVLLGSPVYHGSFTGVFKNFHDHCGWDEYEDTAVGLVATAGGGSYASTLEHMRSTVRGVHGHVAPEQVGIRNASDEFTADPTAIDDRALTDPDIEDRLRDLGAAVVRDARRIAAHDPAEGPRSDS
jgi:azobenzene reductase